MNVNFLEICFQDEWGFKRIFFKVYVNEHGEVFKEFF